MLLKIEKSGEPPCYRQVCDQVMHLIDEGTLPVGARLPATRMLARQLGLNRSTIYRAYQELWALGYLESRPGSYSTVRGRLRPRGVEVSGAAPFDWSSLLAPPARHAVAAAELLPGRQPAPEGVISFASLSADRSLCPLPEFRAAMRQVLAENGPCLLDYGDAAGYRPLREVIARRMRTHSVHVQADEILVTAGAMQGLDLVLQALTEPGMSVVVESPTYTMMLPLLKLRGLQALEVPMGPDGLDLNVLETVLASRRPALLYTIPTFHNPTGTTTSQAHRERLLAMCETHRVPILEDGFEEEMKYFGKAVLPIKSMDRSGQVIYLGTLSKVAFPGLRVGWIAAPTEAIRALIAIHRVTHLSGSILGQAAVARFCADGTYEAHLRRIHTVYRRRMLTMLRSLKEHMPPGRVTWTQPAGGYTLWLEVTGAPGSEEPRIIEHLRAEGVLVAPGSAFFPRPPDGVFMRLSISTADEGAIAEGCRRLGRALAEVVG
jgi:DNA-binding transcriptional MocR family regulator